ncbi:uncharacterized protein JCM15063_006241 [Sporobolomyces koalae]|uniref:uncharacterized protein n=1 Tax=Sporobolomyces koalae TaxID=500713 RepID=UPI00316DB569
MSSSSKPFLHVKFTALSPVPQYGHQLPFAHLVDPAIHDLPESLKTDVQREGIRRYLTQNFEEGSFVWEVVKERTVGDDEQQEGKDSDGMYIVVNRSWTRTVGDNKLHLSLYVYQEDKHCATWHAYTDRTISYSREGTGADDAAEPDPDEQDVASDNETENDEIPNEDPYSPPSALAQYVASMDSRPSSPFEIPNRDSERPRFDRPYNIPVAESESDHERSARAVVDDRSKETSGRHSRSARKPKPQVNDSSEEEEENPRDRSTRSSKRPKEPETSESEHESEEEEPSKPKRNEPENDRKKRSNDESPIVKSQPIGSRSSRNPKSKKEVSRSPPPVKSHSSRSQKPRAPSRSHSRSQSPSSEKEQSSLPRSKRPTDHKKPEPKVEEVDESRSRSKSPPATRSKARERHADRGEANETEKAAAKPTDPSRSPSPTPQRSRRSRRGRSLSRSPSPASAEVEKPKAHRRSRSSVQPRSRSRSPIPETRRSRPAERSPERATIDRSAANRSTEPTWRSVSRNRHRRPDDSDDDTLVRGNMDDHELDIPAGGETTLLKAKSSKKRGATARVAKDEAFDPDQVERSRVEREQKAPVKPATLKGIAGEWLKSVGSMIATEAKLVVGEVEEDVLKAEVGVEEWEDKQRKERKKRKAERAKRREERHRRKEREEKDKLAKEAELEEMVDRAEDAAEGMLETSERFTSCKEKDAKKKHRDREASTEEEQDFDQQDSRRAQTKESSAGRSRSKHRSSRPSSSMANSEPTGQTSHHRSSSRRRREEETGSTGRRPSRRHDSPAESDNDVNDAAAAPRSAIRQRAMSISATLDAGLKGLRDSVTKIVSNAGQVEDEKQAIEHEEARKKAKREARRIEKEREAIKEERRNIEREQSERKAGREQDRRRSRRHAQDDPNESEVHQRRLLDRSRQPVVVAKKPAPEEDDPRRRDRLAGDSRPPSEPDQQSSRKPIDIGQSSNAVPGVSAHHSTQRNAPPPVFDSDDDSEGSLPPAKSRNEPQGPRSHSRSFDSETDLSDTPSRSSRSMRSMDRSESEADTPAHLEAKRNARRNSTTIPIETIRALREKQVHAGARSIPSSPVLAKERQDFSSFVDHARRDMRKAEDFARREVDKHKPAGSRHHPHQSSSGDEKEQESHHTQSRAFSGDDSEPRFDFARGRNSRAAPIRTISPRLSSPAVVASPYSYYSPTDPPLRPRAVKPESFQYPPPPTASVFSSRSSKPTSRSYTPVSSDESSDEADPSRPPSSRSRRGYSSGGGDGRGGERDYDDDDDASKGPTSRTSSYRFPSGPGTGSERSVPNSTRPLRQVQSFSRTHPSYPFTDDEDEDDDYDLPEAEPRRAPYIAEPLYDSVRPYPPSTNYGAIDDRFEAGSESSLYSSSQRYSGQEPGTRSSRGGSRTMVSKPTSVRNPVSTTAAASSASPVDPYARLDRTTRNDLYTSSYSRANSVDPDHYRHSNATRVTEPNGGGGAGGGRSSGFTGFDSRSPTHLASASSSWGSSEATRSRGKEVPVKRKGVGSSAVPFGELGAPVSRRTLQRLNGGTRATHRPR